MGLETALNFLIGVFDLSTQIARKSRPTQNDLMPVAKEKYLEVGSPPSLKDYIMDSQPLTKLGHQGKRLTLWGTPKGVDGQRAVAGVFRGAKGGPTATVFGLGRTWRLNPSST
jgi:hypothetical protein